MISTLYVLINLSHDPLSLPPKWYSSQDRVKQILKSNLADLKTYETTYIILYFIEILSTPLVPQFWILIKTEIKIKFYDLDPSCRYLDSIICVNEKCGKFN